MQDVTTPAAVEGPAFTMGAKVVATLLVGAVLLGGVEAAPSFAGVSWPAILFLLVAVVGVAVCYVAILRSRTGISATHIRQSWITDKEVAIADITQVKFVYIPGLTWLIAPRLIVKAKFPGSVVFHAADPRVLAAFARLSIGDAPLG